MSPFFAALLACAWMGAVFLVTGWRGRAARLKLESHDVANEHGS